MHSNLHFCRPPNLRCRIVHPLIHFIRCHKYPSRSPGAFRSSNVSFTAMELKQSPRRASSRDLSSRLLFSSSPLHRRSISGALWPSSNSSSTLADHLTNDRLTDLAAGKNSSGRAAGPKPISRQRSCSEFERKEERKISRSSIGGSMRYISKEEEDKDANGKINRSPISGSMRYIAKVRFPRSSKLSSADANGVGGGSPLLPAVTLTPGRIARRISDFGLDFSSFESGHSDTSKISIQGVPRSPVKKTISPAPAPTQWAMSPGRRPESPEGMGGSPNPVKGRKMGSLRSLGLDHLFRRKISSSYSPSSPLSFSGVGELGHRVKTMHTRLVQWRFVNARSDAVMQTKLADVQATMLSAWARITESRSMVVRKRMQLGKEKHRLTLYTVLSSQMKALEEWGDLERQHTSALAATKGCLHAAVFRLPLTDGAKADLQQLPSAIRQAMDLAAATINTTASTLIPMAQKTAPMLLELAQVIRKERSLLDECFEFLGLVAGLQIQEESLRCHLVQLHSINISN
ncbi:uncharacterized protein [Typha angustifolia]|uniref:uncharacterized protein n=1 Tax=Typha angustifolia TaxID=59011 RepID=UPI003C2F3BD4